VRRGDYQAATACQRRIDVLQSTHLEECRELFGPDVRQAEQVDRGDREVPERATRESALVGPGPVGREVRHVLLERLPAIPLQRPRQRASDCGQCTREWDGDDAKQAGRRPDDRGIRDQRAALEFGRLRTAGVSTGPLTTRHPGANECPAGWT